MITNGATPFFPCPPPQKSTKLGGGGNGSQRARARERNSRPHRVSDERRAHARARLPLLNTAQKRPRFTRRSRRGELGSDGARPFSLRASRRVCFSDIFFVCLARLGTASAERGLFSDLGSKSEAKRSKKFTLSSVHLIDSFGFLLIIKQPWQGASGFSFFFDSLLVLQVYTSKTFGH